LTAPAADAELSARRRSRSRTMSGSPPLVLEEDQAAVIAEYRTDEGAVGAVRLAGVHVIPGEVPDGVSSLVERPEFRRDFAVQIDGYGPGRISLLVN
jgi:hypothetical protein